MKTETFSSVNIIVCSEKWGGSGEKNGVVVFNKKQKTTLRLSNRVDRIQKVTVGKRLHLTPTEFCQLLGVQFFQTTFHCCAESNPHCYHSADPMKDNVKSDVQSGHVHC